MCLSVEMRFHFNYAIDYYIYIHRANKFVRMKHSGILNAARLLEEGSRYVQESDPYDLQLIQFAIGRMIN